MPYFDASNEFQCPFTVWTPVPLYNIAKIANIVGRQFGQFRRAPAYTRQVVTLLVCPADKIAHLDGGPVGEDGYWSCADGPNVAGGTCQHLCYFVIARESESADCPRDLDFIEGVVSTKQEHREPGRQVLELRIANYRDSLHDIVE